MAKTDTALTPSFDVEVYKAQSESINQNTVTLLTTSKALLERGLQTEEDYAQAVRLGNDAASQAKRHTDNFDPLCKGLNSLHKMSTKLRDQYAAPWTKLSEALRGAAKKWFLDAERAKQEAERDLARKARGQQEDLAVRAQDLIDQGYVKEGRLLLQQAQVLHAPVLPDAVPEVEGARVTHKYTATCTDLTAVMAEILSGRLDLMWEVRGEMRPLVIVDQVVLNNIVSRLGPNLKCPGIKVEKDVQIGATKL